MAIPIPASVEIADPIATVTGLHKNSRSTKQQQKAAAVSCS